MHLLKAFVYRIISTFVGLILLGAIFYVIEFFSVFSNDEQILKSPKTSSKEIVNDDRIISRKQIWQDYDMNWHNNSLQINYGDYLGSLKNKINSDASSLEGNNGLYRDMYVFDKPRLNLIYKELNNSRLEFNLSKIDFADMIVSMVQNMPYNVITQDPCFQAYANNSNIKELMDSGFDCDGEVYGGVYSPLQFIFENKGDCDSRTIFLYTLLKKFNYDVVILNSDFYGHSIIGLNIPSTGSYKLHLGKRYYTWESTAKNWLIGQLPPGYTNLNYWYVALQ